MDWVLIITLILSGASSGGNYASVHTIDFLSEDACDTAKELYIAENPSHGEVTVTAVCVSKATVIRRQRPQ